MRTICRALRHSGHPATLIQACRTQFHVPGSAMQTRILTWLFAFLLLGMQQGAQLHAISHLGEALQRPHEAGLQLPAVDAPCEQCALFAAGSAAIPGSSSGWHDLSSGVDAPRVATASPALAALNWYLSRAPPSSLL